jgi:hypothetical protein
MGELEMKLPFCAASLLALAVAVPAAPNSRIKIDTVPSEYAPNNSPTNREPVSMSSYRFEVSPETRRARLVVDYTYPDQMTYGPDDDAGGPAPTIVQIPGLTYDVEGRAVVYNSNGMRDVCATVTVKSGIFGQRFKTRKTGACTVETVVANHAEDTGWDIHRFRAIDVYFEVR